MTDTDCLIPGDAIEAQTRRRYAAWALAARSRLGPLAPDPLTLVQWPKRSQEPRGVAQPMWEPVASDAIAHARAEGWLVTPPAPQPREDGPLAGVAVAVKDVIDVEGLPTANGRHGSSRIPARSAPAWSRLATSGAWCVGKAATHECAWGVTTPTIRNPVDPSRYAGGSSGGSAAAVAGGAATAGLGTDTGGSIRIPAALCGVVGVKPTLGSIETGGVTPLAPEQDVIGTLTRTVDQAGALLEVLLGRSCIPESDAVSSLRIGFLVHPGALQEPVAKALDMVDAALTVAGAVLVPLDTSLHRLATSLSLLTMLTSSARLHADAVRQDPESYGSTTRALLTLGEGLDVPDLDPPRRVLLAETARLFHDHDLDAVLMPTTPCVAPERGTDWVEIAAGREPIDGALTRFTAWASATGLPAVATPIRGARLPVSMQVMAPPLREDVCLHIARFVESVRIGA